MSATYRSHTSVRSDGLALVELMVAMALGLIVIGGAISLLVANKQSYRSNEALSQLQESARTAFELMARDIRQAGVNGCDNTGRISNVLNNAGLWWQSWFGLRGYEQGIVDPAAAIGTAFGQRFAGTDSIQLQGIEGTGLTIENHDPTAANFKINATTTAIATGDILMVCDFDHAAIVQVTSYNSSNVTVVHNTGGSEFPGNYTKGLGYPPINTINGNPYVYGPNSQIARFTAADWYIGNNGRATEGGLSLFRRKLGGAVGGTPSDVAEEIVSGVVNMQLTYREQANTDFVAANAVGNWLNVNAVMIQLTLRSADQRVSTDASVNSGRLERAFTNIVTLRNRVP